MKRRQFLGQASGLATAALSAGSLAQSSAGQVASDDASDNYDVIVLGGGFAGVVAARDSSKHGYRTLLLEARNRLGGRTFSSEFEGSHIEYGGTWVYNNQPFVWAEIERYGLEIAETPGAVPDQMFLITDSNRQALTDAQLVEAAAGWDLYTAGVRSILPRPYDLLFNAEAALHNDSVSALEHLNSLRLTPLQHAFNKGLIEVTSSSSADKVSHLEMLRFYMLAGTNFANFMDAVTRFKLRDGTGGLVDEIISDGDAQVRLATPVKSVKDRGDRVVVTTQRGEAITCRSVISCLPLNTIADVTFHPALPTGVIEVAKQRHPGSGAKLYIKVEKDLGNIATVAPGRPVNYLMTYERSADHTLMVAFVGDTNAIDVYDDDALQKELDVHVPGARMISSTLYDWNSDPYSRGTWATYRPGWVAKYLDQFQKNQGRVHFGSGDHGEGWRGTIDSAIGAGARAAQAVHEQLG